LTTTEQSVVKVLKNTKLSPRVRLALYHKILFDNSKNFLHKIKIQNRDTQTDLPITQPIIKMIQSKQPQSAQQTQTNFSTGAVSRIPKPTIKIDDVYETEAISEDVDMTNVSTPIRRLQPPNRKLQLDDDDVFDPDKEHDDFIQNLDRLSDGDIDYDNLVLEGVDDPNKDYINIHDQTSNLMYSLDKSPAVIRRQQLRQNADIDDPSTNTETSTPSGVRRGTRLRKETIKWKNFKDLRKDKSHLFD
jgi:hypothetical protein